MKISLNWIKDFITIDSAISAQELGLLLTRHTAEVESVHDEAKDYEKIVVGKVLSVDKHPDADRLNVVKVDIGTQDCVQIVCGGQNLQVEMLVPVALPGSFVRWHGEGELVQLSETKIRGVKSFGMICAGEEIGLPNDNLDASGPAKICDLSYLNVKSGTNLADALEKNQTIIEIDNKSLTHRPDLWGHYGIAREFAAILDTKIKDLAEFTQINIDSSAKENMTVQIEDPEICDRFSACTVSNIKIEESPAWLKNRLISCGINPHNNIVDITNYVMLELGQPMHAYDKQTVGSSFLKARKAKKGEKLITLDESEYEMNEGDIIVANEHDEALGMAGIKGGLKSGINEQTVEIILESASWNKIIVRKTSNSTGLRTDASQRFEKGIDPFLTEVSIKRALVLIKELCPNATISSQIKTVGTWQDPKIKLEFDAQKACKKIGVNLNKEEVTNILEKLGFLVEDSGEKITVHVPSFRATGDISIEEDLVEEVARLYGYEKIPAIMPNLPIQLPKENKAREFKNKSREILSQLLGFTELMNYSFYNQTTFEACGFKEEDHLKLKNALSEDQTHMRVSLLPNFLNSIKNNQKQENALCVFEFGHTYKECGDFMPKEEKMLMLGAYSSEKDSLHPFYKAKSAFEILVNELGFADLEFKNTNEFASYEHPKQSLEIYIDGILIGKIYSLHPYVKNQFNINGKLVIVDINFDKLMACKHKTVKFAPLAKFPSMPMDISVVVDKKTYSKTLEDLMKKSDSNKLIESVKLFDVYEGDKLPEDKKALSFHIELRHAERTLTDAEFKNTQESIFIAMEKFGGTIRGRT